MAEQPAQGHVRVGVDLVDVGRMARALERTPSIRRRVFSEAECLYCEGRAAPAEHYAARFAAREAVLKALGTGFRGMGYQDVTVELDERGAPSVALAGGALERARELGVEEVALSLSHTAEVACANVVLITSDARPRRTRTEAPEARLMSSFKKARSIVYELEAAQRASNDEAGIGHNIQQRLWEGDLPGGPAEHEE